MINLLGLGDALPVQTPGDVMSFTSPTSTAGPQVSFDASTMPERPMWLSVAFALLDTASAMASGYHGYKRNNSIGWGIAWFALGATFPVITPTIAFAQGFGKRK